MTLINLKHLNMIKTQPQPKKPLSCKFGIHDYEPYDRYEKELYDINKGNK